MTDSICPGCGLSGPAEHGGTHPYMLSSPLCWRLYNDVLARDYGTAALMATHFLGVDAFAVQHPGDPAERRARQSVWLHLAGLHAVLRRGQSPRFRYHLLRRLSGRSEGFPPPPQHMPFALTAADVSQSGSDGAHQRAMRDWAESALSAYLTATPDLAARIAELE